MAYAACCQTHPGLARSRNEDSSLLLQWELTGYGATLPVVLAAVADGMGGHANGHLASSLTLRTLASTVVSGLGVFPAEPPPGEPQLVALLQEAVAACAARVNRAIDEGCGPMGSTLAAALLWGRRLLVCNVGDSRVYLVHRRLQQISTDHSLVARLVAQGDLSEAEARVHPRRNEIYRMIGFGRKAEPDLYALDLEEGDSVLLCSDGLYTMVPDDGLFDALSQTGLSLAQRCRRLVQLANAAGGEDNITAVLVQMDAIPAAPTASVPATRGEEA